ncbi:MAG TPA: class I adenylate-forming enzyme family protein [Pseudonocardiaceae bacterium]|jgi:acyl-CoA synthetase (AMP-forming)/AMP-acid ligase II|nr:class I adenylate-forming enzyme family protein [Pseudonocardiaceae bacterium]
MAEITAVPPAHLRWSAEALAPGVREALTGVGAPFELRTENVLGHDAVVFAQRPRSLRQLLDTRTAVVLDLPFLVSPSREWTYREALQDIDATAVLLTERYGVRAGDRVAIVAANSAEYGLLMWAVVSIGAIVTSLNGWWTAPELEYGIRLTTPALVAGDERRLARLAPGSVPDGVPVRLLGELHHEAREFLGQAPRPAEITEDSAAVILFTSGTTGRPKGASLSHRNIVNFAMVSLLSSAAATAAAPADTPPAPQGATILTSPMFHISGMLGILMTGAALRTKLVFAPPGAWDPGRYLRLSVRHRVTSWSGVPTQFWRLLRHPELAAHDVSSVLTVGSGGAVFPPELVRELHEKLPGARLGNGYGMSESVGLGTLTGGDLFLTVPESVGPAQATVEVQIRDEEGTVLHENEVGEIHLRTPSIFLGYWNDEPATAAAFGAGRWYRTGDFGRIAEGLLFLESRRRDMILRGGENIYPIEIENRLVEHPEILDAAVIGVDHRELGQEVKAFVVTEEDSPLTAEDVRGWCAATLAAFKVPARVEFRDALPYTLTGKVMKQQLEQEERALRVNPEAGQGPARR